MKLIDASNITDYNLSYNDLEVHILFWICAAGKNGDTSAKALYKFLSYWEDKLNIKSPFDIIRKVYKKYGLDYLANQLKINGIGCFNNKAKSFLDLVNSKIDLKNCTVDELENIRGIGPKTARCFLIHSRKDQNYAGLDVHVLRFLRDKGHDVPKSTPNGKKYLELEKIFLQYVKKSNMNVSDFDLYVWKTYSGRSKIKN